VILRLSVNFFSFHFLYNDLTLHYLHSQIVSVLPFYCPLFSLVQWLVSSGFSHFCFEFTHFLVYKLFYEFLFLSFSSSFFLSTVLWVFFLSFSYLFLILIFVRLSFLFLQCLLFSSSLVQSWISWSVIMVLSCLICSFSLSFSSLPLYSFCK
jgi:hypothetical protein